MSECLLPLIPAMGWPTSSSWVVTAAERPLEVRHYAHDWIL